MCRLTIISYLRDFERTNGNGDFNPTQSYFIRFVRTFDKYYLLWNKDKQDIFLIRADKVIMLYPVKIQQKPIKNKSPIKSNDQSSSFPI